jgi:subtilase family serine protease
MQPKNSLISLAIAVVLMACWATVAFGQSSVTIPHSSIARPSDAGVRSHTNIQIMAAPTGARAPNGGPPFSGLFYEDPASLACIYSLMAPQPWSKDKGCNPNDPTLNNPTGGSQAIAVVDAYDDPNASSDLYDFSAQFGVPGSPKFSVVYAPPGNPSGTGCSSAAATEPPPDPTGGWQIEESLDIEYAHSMAPQATLYLVEAQSAYDVDLFCAVRIASQLVAKAGGGEVSMSFGSGEFPQETVFDSTFTTPKVVYFASAGDAPGVIYPSASPSVVSVGGTSTDRDPVTGSFLLESVWQTTGGGPSAVEPRPTYQNHIQNIVGGSRGTPDMVADANPYTGVWVLDDAVIPDYGTTYCGAEGLAPTPCWLIVGGTSVASPTLAGIVNAAGNFAASSADELNTLYGDHGGDFNNIVTGSCGPYMGYFASNNWSFCNGLGSPNGYPNQKR